MKKKQNESRCCETNEVHERSLKIVNEDLPGKTELYDLAELFKVFRRFHKNPDSLRVL